MRIQLQQEGGLATFPGLNRPVTIDTDALPPDEAAALHDAVARSRFFDRPERVGAAPPGAADYRQYTVSVDDGQRQHSVQLTEPIADPDLQALVEQVRRKARSAGSA